MESAPVIVITDSDDEKGDGNGSKEKKIERVVAVKSKLDEYKEISDLTGFENLKAMILAESVMKRNSKKKIKDKTKLESVYRETTDLVGFENPKAMIEAETSMRSKNRKRKKNKIKTQENDTVNVAEEQVQLSENEGSDIVEEKERRRRRRRKIAKLKEYEKISDLSGFENLKAQAFMRRKKRSEKNREGTNEICDQEDVTVNAEGEKGQLDEIESLEVVEVSKPESVQTSEMDEPQHLVIDPTEENEVASTVEVVQATRAKDGDDGVNSVEVIDLCLSSSEDDKSVSGVSLERSVDDSGKAAQTAITTGANDRVKCVEVIDLCQPPAKDDKAISDVTLGTSVEDKVPLRPVTKRRKRRKKKSVIAAKDKIEDAKEENDAKYNAVLRMLLRKPRYFDPPDWNSETCSNCGKENHTAASCRIRKQIKPCFLCASFKHGWKYCTQGQDCFISRGTDRLVGDCPQTDQENHLASNICLRCGDSGHDMFSCVGDYPTDDLKEIQCYVCKSFGHLCCVNSSNIDQRQVSCYNCGQSGHLGPECTQSFEASDGLKSDAICYKCGKKGHIANRCGRHFKDRLRLSDLLSTSQRLPFRARMFIGFHSSQLCSRKGC